MSNIVIRQISTSTIYTNLKPWQKKVLDAFNQKGSHPWTKEVKKGDKRGRVFLKNKNNEWDYEFLLKGKDSYFPYHDLKVKKEPVNVVVYTNNKYCRCILTNYFTMENGQIHLPKLVQSEKQFYSEGYALRLGDIYWNTLPFLIVNENDLTY